MSKPMLTPKFISKDIAKIIVDGIIEWAFTGIPFGSLLKRKMCHIVILVPSMPKKSKYPKYRLEPHVLLEVSYGNKKSWVADYSDIAQCKALQLWHDRDDDRTDVMPHLLFPGDHPFWGGVKRDGIVVACSGFQPWYDKMVSGMIADALIAFAYDTWKCRQKISAKTRD